MTRKPPDKTRSDAPRIEEPDTDVVGLRRGRRYEKTEVLRDTRPPPAPSVPGSEAADTPGSSEPTEGEEGLESGTGLTGLPERYELLEPLGEGGTARVYRVYDRTLDRSLAMKVLHARYKEGRVAQRFLAEGRLTAGLQHPGIVAVHDRGVLPDGRPWLTMQEVRGRTFNRLIDEYHRGDGDRAVSLRRLTEHFDSVCRTVAYAHSRGVVHRDLKPSNLMIGEFGEVLVMDWGLAREGRGAGISGMVPAEAPSEPRIEGDTALTKDGEVLGTPAYMAPEQAGYGPPETAPTMDVYALGSILYVLLTGRLPYTGGAFAIWFQLGEGPPPPVREVLAESDLPIPEELCRICERAMAREPSNRYEDAGAVSRAIRDFLDGARREEEAAAVVGTAMVLEPDIAALEGKAKELRREADHILADVAPHDPIDKKRPAWQLQDRAAELDRQAAVKQAEWLQTLRSALNTAPDFAPALERLADYYKGRLTSAETARDARGAALYETMLRAHDRGRHAAFLEGIGAVTLVTDPPGAQVILHRYVEKDRRLVAEQVRELGRTPLIELPLKRGSYLLEICADGRMPVRYPVSVARGEHWHGVRPGDTEPFPIHLPEPAELRENECYVPAGWFQAGDPEAADGLPVQRVWVDPLIMARHPVTNAEYIDFLNGLVVAGRESEALFHAPRNRSYSEQGESLYFQQEETGRFALPAGPDEDGDAHHPDLPVILIRHESMRLFAASQGARLPNSLEWEKAARGVDGRSAPWGDHLEADWACSIQTQGRKPSRCTIHEFPIDESPYGVRGLAGNVRDLCDNRWLRQGPPLADSLLVHEPAGDLGADEYLAARGGAWSGIIGHFRAATRFAAKPDQVWKMLGFRLVRVL